MSYLGSYKIDDYLTFCANTHDPDTGVATDADSVPTYRVYEDETATPILTGSTALLDAANTTGFYSERVQLTAANGLEKGKCYTIYITATVDSDTGTMHHTFQIEAEVDANTVSATADVNVTQISGDSGAADNAEAFFDGTGYAGTNNVIPTVTTLTGHTDQTGDNYARLGSPAGASIAADLLTIDNLVDDLETRLTATRAGYLDELAAANVPADIDTLLTRITAAVALASVCTEARLAELDAANLPTDIADVPTVAEFNARTQPTADYFDPANDAVANVTLVTTTTTNTDMVGTDSAALASVCTETRLAELAAANLPADVDTLISRITAAVALASICTEGRLAELDAANLPTDIAALPTTAEVNTEVDTALSDIHLDHLLAVDYDPASKPGVATALLNELFESDGGVSRYTANALEEAPTGGSAPTVVEIRTEMDDNSTQLAAIVGDTNELQTDWRDGGRLDLLLDAVSTHSVTDVTQRQIPDSVPTDGTLPTIEQALYMITQFLHERAVSGTTVTVRKVDGSTSLLTLTLDDDTDPTSITRAT